MGAQRDPHDIVPSEFWDEHGSLAQARSAPSTTDDGDRPRCPADGCGSVQITPRSDKPTNQSPDYSWRCTWCGHTFRSPLPPENEVDDDGESN